MRQTINIFYLCILFLSASGVIYGQQSDKRERLQYVIAPRQSILLVIASQPDCPLQIKDVKLLVGVEQGDLPLYQFQLHNRGTKPIRYYTLGAWSSEGTGSTLGDGRITDRIIMPGQTIFHTGERYTAEIVPLTDQLRDKLKLQGPLKAVIVLIVESVTFADGSAYNDRSTSKALRDYFNEIGH